MKNKHKFLDIRKAGFEPVAKDEIFVKVHNTHNYWISNHGRTVNNLKGKDNFYMYKTGNVHLTLTSYYIGGERVPKDIYIKDLVAEHFLVKPKGKDHIYFVDGNKENNYYKNLVYLDSKELYAVKNGVENIEKYLDRQEYIDYLYKGNQKVREAYNLMYKRTHDEETKKYFPQYADATMYKPWEDDPELCMEYLESIYYECGGEQMVVDKDLLCKGNKDYAPGKICFLPWTLNVMLSNSKKHYNLKHSRLHNEELPYGVRYDESNNKYYAEITMDKALRGDIEKVRPKRFKYRDTPEEAFADYKKHKEAYIIMMADKYMDYLPVKIYDALIDYEVEPF